MHGYGSNSSSRSVYRQFPPSNITGNQCIPYGGSGSSRDFYAPVGSNYQWSTTPAGQFAFIGSTTSSYATIYALNSSANGAILLTYNRPCDNQSVTVNLGIYTSQYCPSSFAADAPEEDGLVIVHPNPVSDKFTVEYNGNKKQVQFKLYNAYNELLKEGQIAKSSRTVRVDDLPGGLYYLHVFTDKAILTRKRIVIRR